MKHPQVHRGRGPRRARRGQALTEFLVAALVLVPLFMLIPMIGKYQDVAHSTLMASRYVAFEATVRNDSANSWKPEAQLAQEVRRRFFGNASTPIKADDAAGDFTADRNAMWTDPTGRPLLRRFDQDVVVTFGPGNGTRHADAFTGAHDGEATPGHNLFDGLPARGIYNGNVTVSLANLPGGIRAFEPFDQINLSIRRGTAVLIDPWAARSPGDVQGRLDSAAVNPAVALEDIRPVIDLAVTGLDGYLLTLGSIRAPRLGQVDFWADVVQPDRLR